jgi:Fe-S cluster assembly protein SufD
MTQAVSSSVERYLRAYADQRDTLPGRSQPWVRALREQALANFRDRGFPTARDEAWKYTRLNAIENTDFVPASNGVDRIDESWIGARTFATLSPHLLVFVNGRFSPGLSRLGRLPGSVHVDSLAAVLQTHPDLVEPHLGRLAGPGSHGLASLNTALMADGACVVVPAGASVEAPIHVLSVGGTDSNTGAHIRNLYVAQAGSRATIIESYLGLADLAYLTNVVSETVVGRNAVLHHYKLQQESPKAHHIADLHVRLARESRLEAHSFSLGGQLARHGVSALLAEEGVHCSLNGLYLADGRRHVDTFLFVDHAQVRGTSRENFKGVVSGRARGVFNGKVLVRQDAQQTDAHMGNKNLLLSKDAEVDTRPQLEIYADDVRCTHGATVGQLDDDALFYLRSRGIDEQTARGFLIFGFAHDIVDRIPDVELRKELERVVVEQLPHHDQFKELL